jgi:phosphate:Na+ symporter
MQPTFTLFDLFSLLCGLAIFLYGMQQGEKVLRTIGGSDLRKIITILTKHRLSAYLAGLLTTFITQSSSATTVMLVSLASARLMTLGQSLGMILGSDLGTTFTVQLFAFKFYQIAPLLIAVGYFSSLSRKSEKMAGYGGLLLSLGFIFFGMYMMTQSVTPLRSLPVFDRMMSASLTNPWYGLLAGTLITAAIQSSAATLAILIAVAQAYQIDSGWVPSAISLFPVILGANLGTCVTAFISTIRADLEGVRVAWAHFTFKLLGVLLIFPFIGLIKYVDLFPDSSVALQIAAYHTIFNIFISVLFLPFLHQFENLIIMLVKPRHKQLQPYNTLFLNENTLSIPYIAISQAIKEITVMSERVTGMVEGSRKIVALFDHKLKTSLINKDDEVDFFHEQIITFLTRISREGLNPEQATRAYELLMITTDLEHIGDIVSKGITNLAEKISSSPLPLSTEGKQEILEFFDTTISNLKETLAAFVLNDLERAHLVFERKEKARTNFEILSENHMNRLYNHNKESLQTTSIHSDLLEEIRRINHYAFRIAAHQLRIHKAE